MKASFWASLVLGCALIFPSAIVAQAAEADAPVKKESKKTKKAKKAKAEKSDSKVAKKSKKAKKATPES